MEDGHGVPPQLRQERASAGKTARLAALRPDRLEMTRARDRLRLQQPQCARAGCHQAGDSLARERAEGPRRRQVTASFPPTQANLGQDEVVTRGQALGLVDGCRTGTAPIGALLRRYPDDLVAWLQGISSSGNLCR